MLNKLLTYTKFGALFCGVEHTSINDKEQLSTLLLNKKKDAFFVEMSFESDTVSDLKEYVPKNQHLFLIVNTDQVLSKTLNGVYSEQKAITEAFPNLNSSDFYYEVYATHTKTFVAIGRKDYINNLLELYKAEEFNCIGFSLGNLTITQLKSIVDVDFLETSNSSITFVENELETIKPLTNSSEKEYTLNGLDLTNFDVLPLSGIISYYTQQNFTESNFTEVNTKLHGDFKQERIFKTGLVIGLTFIFISLLVSFLFLSHYSAKMNTISSELELNKTYKNSLLQLTDEVNKKERLVTDFSLSSSKASWYLDHLGNALPSSITLTDLQFQPLQKSIKKDKSILIEENMILVKGTSTNNEDFSNWMNLLEKLDWVEKSTIREYGTDKKLATEFELELKLITE